nr:hypothetical protein [Curtobacterium sp. PhB115]
MPVGVKSLRPKQLPLPDQPPTDPGTVAVMLRRAGRPTVVLVSPHDDAPQHGGEVRRFPATTRTIFRREPHPPDHAELVELLDTVVPQGVLAALNAATVHPSSEREAVRGRVRVQDRHITVLNPVYGQRCDASHL